MPPSGWSRVEAQLEQQKGRRRDEKQQLREAREALRQAMGSRRLHHVATVNSPIPERVAGADLVPLIAADAADRGAGLFLLGGENGAAHAAAAALVARNPALRICGVLESPRASLEEMENEEIVQQIRDSGADVLLVALGHPKQDLWIDRHRECLSVSIAVGVGCVFDLLAGRATRAPGWMQRAGLEWLYRVAHEPARLGGRYATDLRWLLVLASKSVLMRASSRGQIA